MKLSSLVSAAAVLACLAACASPETGPAAPAPVPTPRPVPRPALVVTTAARSSATKPTPAQLSVYAIGGDGRLTLAAPPQPIGSLDRVHAASYTASSGLYRQVVSETPLQLGGVTTLVTYVLDLATGVFSPLGSSPLPRPYGLVGLHPNGRFLYASAGHQELHGYELDPGNGALLRPIPGMPFGWNAPMGITDFSFSASGHFAWGHGRIRDGYHSNRGFVLSFAIDPATGVLRTSDETPVFDQQSRLAVSAREDVAYLVDRTGMIAGAVTWRRFSVDGAGGLDQEELWPDRYGCGLHFTTSGRFLLAADSVSLLLLERAENGRPVRRTMIDIPRSSGWDVRRTLYQVGDFVYLFGDRTLAVVELDEPARTLTLVQQVTPGDDLEVLSVALALPAP